MLIVADTSALVALAACASLPLLDDLFSEVRVPDAVFRECTVSGKPFAEPLRSYLEDRVVHIDLSEFIVGASGLGQGELEAIALYKRLDADRLLVDDGRGRRFARANGVDVIGSAGILLAAKSEGLLPAVAPLLEQIQSAGIHLSAALLQKVLQMADELPPQG